MVWQWNVDRINAGISKQSIIVQMNLDIRGKRLETCSLFNARCCKRCQIRPLCRMDGRCHIVLRKT